MNISKLNKTVLLLVVATVATQACAMQTLKNAGQVSLDFAKTYSTKAVEAVQSNPKAAGIIAGSVIVGSVATVVGIKYGGWLWQRAKVNGNKLKCAVAPTVDALCKSAIVLAKAAPVLALPALTAYAFAHQDEIAAVATKGFNLVSSYCTRS